MGGPYGHGPCFLADGDEPDPRSAPRKSLSPLYYSLTNVLSFERLSAPLPPPLYSDSGGSHRQVSAALRFIDDPGVDAYSLRCKHGWVKEGALLNATPGEIKKFRIGRKKAGKPWGPPFPSCRLKT